MSDVPEYAGRCARFSADLCKSQLLSRLFNNRGLTKVNLREWKLEPFDLPTLNEKAPIPVKSRRLKK